MSLAELRVDVVPEPTILHDDAPALMENAYAAHLRGELANAESIYRNVLLLQPKHAEAMHYLGVLLHQRGCSDEAVALIKQSITLEPQRADWRNDLGNVFFQRNELALAMDAFMDSVMLDRSNAAVWNNMGVAAQQMGLYIEANYSFRQAIELEPNFVEALNNLGNLLKIQGYPMEALECLSQALVLGPTENVSKKHLGLAYYALGRIDEAAKIYRSWLEEEPNNPIATHLFAACAGADVPPRASLEYVERYFDDCASFYEEEWIDNLGYSLPAYIEEVVEQLALPAKSVAILDLGCGTGLCAEALAPYAKQLIGIDLSENMLAIARTKGIYSSLHKQDISAYLAGATDTFNMVIMADTLMYFGDVDSVMQGVTRVLQPNGLVIFSVELNESSLGNYAIKPNGRYGHHADYIKTQLTKNSLGAVIFDTVELRLERGEAVNGLLVVAKRSN